MIFKYEKCDSNEKIRLDVFVSENTKTTRSGAQKLIEDGCVLINGKQETKNYKLRDSDEIEVNIPEPKVLDVLAEDIPLDIVYEDEDLIIVNKPQGMVVHPAAGNYDGTLVNAIMHHAKDNLSAINGVIRPGIVHRIDKETSGLLVIAKNNSSHLILAELIKRHLFDREYICLANGRFSEDKFTVSKPIGRHPKDRKKMAITEKNSKHAVTHFEVLERFETTTLLLCTLETGRTHQIRVHLQSLGKSIVGDPVYGLKKDAIASKYHFKRADAPRKKAWFLPPQRWQICKLYKEPPEYFNQILNDLRKASN